MVHLQVKLHSKKRNSKVIHQLDLGGAILPVTMIEGQEFSVREYTGIIDKVTTTYNELNRSWNIDVAVIDCEA